MTAPRITLEDVHAFEWPFRLRLPFRFGVITVTHGRQAVVVARVRLENGRVAEGMAAETLAAKWFDKDPALTDAQNEHQLRRAIEIARNTYLTAEPRTPFALFADSYAAILAQAATERLPPLVAGFGPALLDRAVLDAVLRAHGVSFATGMRANVAGIGPHPAIADLGSFDWNSFLASLSPRPRIAARHTVGLVDPITAADQPAGTRVEDGLPETLEEVCASYRHGYFKLKVGGDVAADVDRLSRIAAVLDRALRAAAEQAGGRGNLHLPPLPRRHRRALSEPARHRHARHRRPPVDRQGAGAQGGGFPLRPWRQARCRRHRPVLQLPLLALQHEHRGADRGDVHRRVRRGAGFHRAGGAGRAGGRAPMTAR